MDIHEEVQRGRGAPTNPYRELPRGAVVFAVGALDAYLSEVSAEVMVHGLGNAIASSDARETLKRIQNAIPTLALEVAVLPTEAQRLERIRGAVVDHFQNRASMHGARAVSATAERIGTTASDVWSALGSRGSRQAAETLDRWTDIRHQVVHQGRSPPVRRREARQCIKLIEKIAGVLDGFAVKK